MPRVSAAYREARRDQIAAAMLRVIERSGLRAATMAEIVAESGLSPGSVYSHFATKDEVLELVATRVIGARTDELAQVGDQDVLPPLEVVRWWLAGLEADGVPMRALVQIWGEAATDPAIRAIVVRRAASVEEAFREAVHRWLVATGGDPATAPAIAATMLTVCQGYIVRTAVMDRTDLDGYLAGIGVLGAAG